MQFMIKAYDGEGMLEKRMEVRPLHIEGMKKGKMKMNLMWMKKLKEYPNQLIFRL